MAKKTLQHQSCCNRELHCNVDYFSKYSTIFPSSSLKDGSMEFVFVFKLFEKFSFYFLLRLVIKMGIYMN